MKHIFNIAINVADQDIQISLHQDGKSASKIMLGGIEYAIDYSGLDAQRAAIVHELEEKFKTDPVTTESLQDCLNQFGIVVVTELSEKLQRGLDRAKLIGKGLQAMQERSLSNIADEARGRMIQDHYYFEAKNNEGGDVFANQKRQLLSLWKADEATKLSLPDWETYKKRQWEQAKGSTEFLPWLYTSWNVMNQS